MIGKSAGLYQFAGAASGEDPARTLEVQMSRAPATHVKPLNCPGGTRPIFFVQYHQLFQSPDSCVFQHLLQLKRGARRKKEVSINLLSHFTFAQVEINSFTSPRAGSWSPRPTIRMQSAWRMQR